MRADARPETEFRHRAPRPPSRSRTRTGSAASAVVLMMLGTSTLGAFPMLQTSGRPVTVVAGSTPLTAPLPLPDPESLVGNTVTAAGVGVLPNPLLADQVLPGQSLPGMTLPGQTLSGQALPDAAPLEQREARFSAALPDQRAQVAIRTAMAQLGLPYVWGGDGPTNGDAGFDCSGLTTFSYAAAGVGLPRTAHTQYYQGPHVPQGAALQPGDLVFYGTPAKVHHVGMYLGNGTMVNAPTFGKPVQTAFYRWNGDDYLGATRPAATGETSTGLLPYAPAAPSTGTPETFPAPTAPAPTTVPDATAPQPAEAVSAAQAAEAAKAAAAATTTVTATPTTSTTPPTTSPAATTSSAAAVVTTTTTTTTTKPATTTTSKPATSTTTPKPATTTTSKPATTTTTPTRATTVVPPPSSSRTTSATPPTTTSAPAAQKVTPADTPADPDTPAG